MCSCTHIAGSNQRSRQGFFPSLQGLKASQIRAGFHGVGQGYLPAQSHAWDVSPEHSSAGKSSARCLRPFAAPARLSQRSKAGSLAKLLDGHKKSSILPACLGAIPEVAGRTFPGSSPAQQPGPGVSRLDPRPRVAWSMLGTGAAPRQEAQQEGDLLLLEILPVFISSVWSRVLSNPISTCLGDM